MDREFFPMGRMISGSKKCPDGHVCVFNANIVTRKSVKLWFGDLDITTDGDALKKYAASVGEPLMILREHDARFQNEANPRLERAVATITPEGEVTIHPRENWI